MADPSPNHARRWIALSFGIACLLAAAHVEFGLDAVFGGGYARRVEALLRSGDARGALQELEASTLLDAEAVALLARMPHSSWLGGTARRDGQLRMRITQQLANELVNKRTLDADGSALLDRVTANAEILVELERTDARSHLLLGLLYLRRGDELRAPIDFIRSAHELRAALARDPDLPLAADALALALGRAQQ